METMATGLLQPVQNLGPYSNYIEIIIVLKLVLLKLSYQ